MRAVSQRLEFTGDDRLGHQADPDTWLTPRYILDQLGAFDLDPCSAEQTPNWTEAKLCLTKMEDGLALRWRGRVFMNPPFSQTSRWLVKHAEHANGISLVPATVESIVWRKYVWQRAKAVLLLHGRTRFCNPDGSTTSGRPLRSIALIAWTEEDWRVLERSKLAGVLVSNWDCR